MKIILSEEQLISLMGLLSEAQKYDKGYVDFILDKINERGIDSLTEKEREYLDRVSSGEDIEDAEDDGLDDLRARIATTPFSELDTDYSLSDKILKGLEKGNLNNMGKPKDVADFFLKKLMEEGLIDNFGAEKENENGIYLYTFLINNKNVYLGDGSMAIHISELPTHLVIFLKSYGLTEKEYNKAVNYIKRVWPKHIEGLDVEALPYEPN